MQRKKVDKSKLPAIDGKCLPGAVYLTCFWKVGKPEIKAKFYSKYKQDPEDVFFGDPHGSVLYAGPIPGYTMLLAEINPIQLDLMPEC